MRRIIYTIFLLAIFISFPGTNHGQSDEITYGSLDVPLCIFRDDFDQDLRWNYDEGWSRCEIVETLIGRPPRTIREMAARYLGFKKQGAHYVIINEPGKYSYLMSPQIKTFPSDEAVSFYFDAIWRKPNEEYLKVDVWDGNKWISLKTRPTSATARKTSYKFDVRSMMGKTLQFRIGVEKKLRPISWAGHQGQQTINILSIDCVNLGTSNF
jgi:hypothetical protein